MSTVTSHVECSATSSTHCYVKNLLHFSKHWNGSNELFGSIFSDIFSLYQGFSFQRGAFVAHWIFQVSEMWGRTESQRMRRSASRTPTEVKPLSARHVRSHWLNPPGGDGGALKLVSIHIIVYIMVQLLSFTRNMFNSWFLNISV